MKFESCYADSLPIGFDEVETQPTYWRKVSQEEARDTPLKTSVEMTAHESEDDRIETRVVELCATA